MTSGSFRQYLLPNKAGTLVAPALLLILLLWFYVNGAIVFGTLWSGFEKVILVYILFLLAAFALAPKLIIENPKAPWYLELAMFGGVAIAVNAVMLFVGLRLQLGPIGGDSSLVVPILALQLAITGSEEAFFRGALWHRRAGPLVSSGLFAGFHAAVYGLSPETLIFAFVAGLLFYMIYEQTRDQFGAAGNWAAHWGYNSGLLGVSIIPFLF